MPLSSRSAARVLTVLLAVLPGPFCRHATAQEAHDMEGWTKEFDEDGMAISSRQLPGAAVREVRVVADVDAPARAARDVIADHDAAPETLPSVAETRVVAREGNVSWVYERIAVPVLSDRDYTSRVVVESLEGAPGGYRIRFEGSDRGPPPRRGVVRIELIRGAWEFLPIDGGSRTRVTYTLVVDPGGIIPGFIANIAARKAVPDVIRALRRWAVSPRYANGG